MVSQSAPSGRLAFRSVLTMEYKATFRNLKYFMGMLFLLIAAVIIVGVMTYEPCLVIIGCALTIYFFAIRFRLRILIAEDGFEYFGLISHWRLKWSEITRVHLMHDYGWPADRFYGDMVYEFKAAGGNKRINFLFFHGDCLRQILSRVNYG